MKFDYVSSVDLLIEVFLYAPKGRHIKMASSVCPAKSCSLCHVQATTFLCMTDFKITSHMCLTYKNNV